MSTRYVFHVSFFLGAHYSTPSIICSIDTRVRMSANERGSPDSDVASQVCFQNPREAVDTEHVISKHSPNDGLGLGLASFAVASAQSDIAVSNMFLSILILALWHPYPVLLAPRACRSSSVIRLSLCQ